MALITLKDVQVGSVYKNNSGIEYEVVEKLRYDGRICYKIKFLVSGYETIVQKDHLVRGIAKDPYAKTVFGVGCVGVVKDKGDRDFYNKVYDLWHSVLGRCYSEKFSKSESYKKYEVKVSDSWLCFENFFKDFQHLPGFDFDKFMQGCLELDKDIKQLDIPYGRVYSKDTCMLVTPEVNRQYTQASKVGQYKVTNPDGEVSTIKNLREFCRKINLNYDSVKTSTRRGTKYKNWLFEKI